MSIFDFFTGGSRISTTSFEQLRSKIVKLREQNLYPYTFNLPQAISFPFDFWDELIKIYKKTNSDGLERAFSVFWADGEIVLTEVKTGSDRMVKSGGSIQVKYSQHPTKKGYARKELLVDEKVLKRRDVYYKNIPKTLTVQYLFNIHTHPKHIDENGNVYYNFFSAQDIKSWISSKAIMTGVVTDGLWILIRSDKTRKDIENLVDNQITPQFLEDDLYIGVYRAEFNKKAYRYKLISNR